MTYFAFKGNIPPFDSINRGKGMKQLVSIAFMCMCVCARVLASKAIYACIENKLKYYHDIDLKKAFYIG
jgi:hypothetical protein